MTAAAALALPRAHKVSFSLDGRDLVIESCEPIPPEVRSALRQAKAGLIALLARYSVDRTGALTGDALLDALRRKGFVIRRYGENAVVDDETGEGRVPAMPLLREVVENHHAFFAALLAWSAPDQAMRGADAAGRAAKLSA